MYTVLIDESGDTGLNGVTPDPSYGPTQYFCLSAVLFREANRPSIERALSSLPFTKATLHAQKLTHFEKAYFCRIAADLPIGLVGVISNKLSLLEYLKEAQKLQLTTTINVRSIYSKQSESFWRRSTFPAIRLRWFLKRGTSDMTHSCLLCRRSSATHYTPARI